MRYSYRSGEQAHSLDVEKTAGGYRVTVDGEKVDVQDVSIEDGRISFQIGGRHLTAYAAADGKRRWVFTDGRPWVFDATTSAGRERARPGAAHGGAERMVAAPMPGQIRAVQIEEGATVEKGQTLLLLEAMKMEIRVQAPRAGLVSRLFVRPGQTVERDQVMVELED